MFHALTVLSIRYLVPCGLAFAEIWLRVFAGHRVTTERTGLLGSRILRAFLAFSSVWGSRLKARCHVGRWLVMASSRRLARKKAISPIIAISQDKSRIARHSFEHPIFGHVKLWSKAGQVYRLHWSSTEYGQNFHARYWAPEKFADVLKRLGL